MRHSIQFATVFLIALLGCAAPGSHFPASMLLAKSPPQNHEYLIHLPGIAGERRLDRQFVAGLRDGGYEGTLEIHDWTEHDPGLAALLGRARHERQANKVAGTIRRLLKEDPARKIRLIGHSGGAGIAVWALERLPEGMSVETLVLIAPALSQQYDLSPSLAHVRGKAYALTSVNDAVVLGAGTRMFGTIDGLKEEAAGMRGFTQPLDADDAQYAKLVAMPYVAEWMDYDNIGNHIGPMSRAFAKKVISPLLQDHRPATTRASREATPVNADAPAD